MASSVSVLKSHPILVHAYIIITAFTAYLSVYFIRGPVFAAVFQGKTAFGGVDLKVALAISQVLGYALGKPPSVFLSTRIQRRHRLRVCLACVVGAAASLFLVATGVGELQCLGILLVGFCLSPLWGVMVMYMEGRRGTEAVIAMTSLAYIAGGGVGKTIGTWVLKLGVSENWMPALIGSVAVGVFAVLIVLLDRAPDPSSEDVLERKRRPPPSKGEMCQFLMKYGIGVFGVLIAYTLAGACRLYREFFTVELWTEVLEAEVSPAMYTSTELPVAICALLAIALVVTIKRHKVAFFFMLGIMCGGICVVGVCTFLQSIGLVSGTVWLVVVGSGLFIALVPPGAMLWDRFMACSGNEMTTIFLIFIGDGISYIASITMLLYKNFGAAQSSPVQFFTTFTIGVSIVACGLLLVSIFAFYIYLKNAPKQQSIAVYSTPIVGDNESLLSTSQKDAIAAPPPAPHDINNLPR